MIKWESMPTNSKQALEMEAKTYKYPTHITLIQEIIANAQDAFREYNTQDPTINISFQKHKNKKFIIFHNNSKPIPESFFKKKYSTLYQSSKNIGEAIGFVGIGAKIFLPSHKDAEIITITGNIKKIASKWICTNKGPQYITSLQNSLSDVVDMNEFYHKNGTTFICRLSDEQYLELTSKISKIIHFWWNPALIANLFTIKIHRKIITSEFPSKIKQSIKSFSIRGEKLNCNFFISDDELDDDYQNIIYTVHGKRIENDKLETALTVKENYGKRIFCYVDVSMLAKYVLKSKEGFEKHKYVTNIKNKIHQRFWDFVKEKELYKDRTKTITKNVELETLVDKLNLMLQNQKFKDLNPFLTKKLRKTIIPTNGGDEPITEVEGTQQTDESGNGDDPSTAYGDNAGIGFVSDDKGKKLGERKMKQTRGLSISEIEHDETEKMEAYVSESDNAVIINTGHPFYKKIEGRLMSEYHKYKIVIEALVRYKAESEGWNTDMSLDKARDLLHSTYD